MNEDFAIRFISHLSAEIQKELDIFYAGTRVFPRVVLRPPLPTSIVLEIQQRLSERTSQVELKDLAKLETHVFLDYQNGELNVWDEGIGYESPIRELNSRIADGTQTECFLMVGNNPALSGYIVTKDSKTVCIDDLAKRIIKPICNALGGRVAQVSILRPGD
jgi:hypothetical protein